MIAGSKYTVSLSYLQRFIWDTVSLITLSNSHFIIIIVIIWLTLLVWLCTQAKWSHWKVSNVLKKSIFILSFHWFKKLLHLYSPNVFFCFLMPKSFFEKILKFIFGHTKEWWKKQQMKLELANKNIKSW
jgi:hypothetical protein